MTPSLRPPNRQIRLSDRASRSNHCLVRGGTVSFGTQVTRHEERPLLREVHSPDLLDKRFHAKHNLGDPGARGETAAVDEGGRGAKGKGGKRAVFLPSSPPSSPPPPPPPPQMRQSAKVWTRRLGEEKAHPWRELLHRPQSPRGQKSKGLALWSRSPRQLRCGCRDIWVDHSEGTRKPYQLRRKPTPRALGKLVPRVQGGGPGNEFVPTGVELDTTTGFVFRNGNVAVFQAKRFQIAPVELKNTRLAISCLGNSMLGI